MNPRRLIPIVVVAGLIIAAFVTRGFGLIPKVEGPLALYGNVDIREVDLGFRVGGRIAQIPIEEGAHVKAGDVLATLDRAPIEDRAAQSAAQVAQAQAQLDKLLHGSRAQDIDAAKARVASAGAAASDAEGDYARRQPLVEPGAISKALWEETVAARDRARAALAEARARSVARSGRAPRRRYRGCASGGAGGQGGSIGHRDRHKRHAPHCEQRWYGRDPGARTRRYRGSR